MLKNDKKPEFDKKNQFGSEIKKNRIRHHQHRASEASGPTRIRFCAKYQKNQHYDPKNPKNHILTVNRYTSCSHLVLIAFRHSNPKNNSILLNRRFSNFFLLFYHAFVFVHLFANHYDQKHNFKGLVFRKKT